MLCIRCGHDNEAGSNFCEKCNAKLLQMAPTGAPGAASVLEVDEHTEYLVPDQRYVTQHLYNLTWRAYEYLHQDGPGEALLEAYQIVRAKLDEFEADAMPEMMAQFQAERQRDPEDDYPKQLIYLMNKGISLYREGATMFDSFVQSGEEPVLIEAVHRMQDGNDNIGLAYSLIAARQQIIHEELMRREAAARAEARQGASEEAMEP
ncbi:MAG: zinc ribbon domain-containing protein [Candidatus Eremiobacterota bacterium]